jgi:hypothetical protein
MSSLRTGVFRAQAPISGGTERETILPVRTLRFHPILLAAVVALLPIHALATTDGLDAPSETLSALEMVDAAEGLSILDAAEIDPDDFIWEWRILAVMADTPNDPAFLRQMRSIESRADDLYERDVVVVTDTSRTSGSPLRQRLRPRGFMLAIIDKDGEIKQRRPAPRDVRELSAVIDRFPLRRQEIMDRLPGRQ